MGSTTNKSNFRNRILPIFSFVFGPILISVGIFVPNILWKIIFIVVGSGLIVSFYLSRRVNSASPQELCPACHGSGSVKNQSDQLSEHFVKNCLSYKATTRTCGMCEGTGKRKQRLSE
ncbi:MAG: hypothetical protein ACTSQC_07085 [Candidatus Heimdallarchaeaceae archaeon]